MIWYQELVTEDLNLVILRGGLNKVVGGVVSSENELVSARGPFDGVDPSTSVPASKVGSERKLVTERGTASS